MKGHEVGADAVRVERRRSQLALSTIRARREAGLLGMAYRGLSIEPVKHCNLRFVADARLPGEGLGTVSQPVREISPGCAADGVTACHGVANRCNGSLQAVAPADPIAEALDRAHAAWISGRDGRRLRRDLLGLLAELEA